MPKKRKAASPLESLPPLSTSGTAATPDGMILELSVVARPFDDADGAPLWKQYRDVYLHERDPKDSAARMFLMANIRCPLVTVKRFVLWAEMLHIPVVFDPPGNMEGAFSRPQDTAAAKAKASKGAKSVFDSLLS